LSRLLLVALIVFLGPAEPRVGWTNNEREPAVRPNIVFILTDDQDAASVATMPRLQSLLVDQGVSYSNAIVTFPLCCPSRASILRGQYAHNHQLLGNQLPWGGFRKFHGLRHEDSTVATWLQAVGYRTVLLGKYLNDYPDPAEPMHLPPGWSEWYSPVDGNPYSNLDYEMNENGQSVVYGSDPDDYLTDVLSRKSRDFIGRSVGERPGEPFFMYISTYAPHEPATPAVRHRGLFAGASAPRSPSFNESDVTTKPAWIRALPLLGPDRIAAIDELYRDRLRSLQAVDELIDDLVDALQERNALDNTYIVFMSDNGFHMGEHRQPVGKRTAYEEDIRVPLIVRGPGVHGGTVLDALVANIDLAPTFAELAGAPPSDQVDGRSLVPLLRSSATPPDWRDAVLIENGPWIVPPRPEFLAPFHAVRKIDSIYVEPITGERELYNLREDPYELQNLAATTDPAMISELSAQLEVLASCRAASCRLADRTTPAP
jgi:N-acetylglucosamine-6-sulfatase